MRMDSLGALNYTIIDLIDDKTWKTKGTCHNWQVGNCGDSGRFSPQLQGDQGLIHSQSSFLPLVLPCLLLCTALFASSCQCKNTQKYPLP